MNRSGIEFDGKPVDLFHDTTINLHDYGVSLPHVTSLLKKLCAQGLDVDDTLLNAEDVSRAIQNALRQKRGSSC